MKFMMQLLVLMTFVLFLESCGGGRGYGAGYWFHFIFVVIPLIVIGILLLKRSENTNESLFTIEGQVRRLSTRIENLEEKVKKLSLEDQGAQKNKESKKKN